MISQVEFGKQAMTVSKEAMPESEKFDGPAGINTPSSQNVFAANSHTALPKPGFND